MGFISILLSMEVVEWSENRILTPFLVSPTGGRGDIV